MREASDCLRPPCSRTFVPRPAPRRLLSLRQLRRGPPGPIRSPWHAGPPRDGAGVAKTSVVKRSSVPTAACKAVETTRISHRSVPLARRPSGWRDRSAGTLTGRGLRVAASLSRRTMRSRTTT